MLGARLDGRERSPAQWIFVAYYGGTVVFVLADYLLDINVRLAFLDGFPGWRALYYLLCAACFILIWRYPAWSQTVAAAESLLTVASLILSMGSRVYVPNDAMIEQGRVPVTPSEIWNFLLSGSAAYLGLITRSSRAKAELDRHLRD